MNIVAYPEVAIRTAQPPDCEPLAQLRAALCPESSAEEHATELLEILHGKPPGSMPLVTNTVANWPTLLQTD
jgi:hypothetical protein